MAETTKTATKAEAKEKMVTIRLPKSRDKQADQFVSVNGHNFLIQRGVDVEVPEYVKEVLDNKEAMENLAIERSQTLQG